MSAETVIDTAPDRAISSPSLRPKEHGAYAILVIPIATSLCIAGGGLVGAAVAIASLAGFFSHEPLLVASGHRGQRAKRSTPEAKPRAIWLLSVSTFAGLTAMWSGSPTVRLSLAGCLLLAVVCFVIAVLGKHRTLGGQLFGVVGLSVPCVPILLAGGISPPQSIFVWAIWLLGFISITLAVRGVIAAQKRQPRTLHWTVLCLATAAVVGAAIAGVYWPAATVPMIGMSWLLMFRPPPAKHLKRVGWASVAGTIATAVAVVIAFASS